MLRAVPDAPQPLMQGRAEAKPVEAPKPTVSISSIADIVELCGIRKDPKLKAMTRSFLRLVKLEPGRLDVSLAPGAPGTLLNELAVKLKDWTGIHWVVSLSRDGGAPTEVEAEARAQAQRMVDASQDPDVAAILSQFPGAKIIDVRVRADEADEPDDVIAAPAVAESDDGDILPGDDVEF